MCFNRATSLEESTMQHRVLSALFRLPAAEIRDILYFVDPKSRPVSPQTQSPLLRLPAEIRNEVYKYALCDQVLDVDGKSAERNLFGLTLACRQLYQETELLIYSRNTLRIKDGPKFEKWLKKRTGPQLAAISTIKLAYCMDIRGSLVHGGWHKDRNTHLWEYAPPSSIRKKLTGLERVVVHADVKDISYPPRFD
jgi:hypothetical protein